VLESDLNWPNVNGQHNLNNKTNGEKSEYNDGNRKVRFSPNS
jgi:hypothetical protein